MLQAGDNCVRVDVPRLRADDQRRLVTVVCAPPVTELPVGVAETDERAGVFLAVTDLGRQVAGRPVAQQRLDVARGVCR
jgi:hypothetical protein